MNTSSEILARLAPFVGREVNYQGMRCTVLDLLSDPPVLVLRPADAAPVIQADNFGKPMRHAPQLYELPVFGPDGCSLSAEMRLVKLPEDPSPAGG
ncbi:hypothetical protein [Thioalkalivibrio sp. XN279]|uniref:hypothetical protein n=1 Tax=Thioalkalivibrio sp. XN279 TaxID=2714953 RepID=UPI00140D7994|nr:hypothetical protein [Thioalkalivibrio sp. XN279]NHA14291.1 hypothetical protein [Thioalkalivibrio sp. XN279]